MIASNARISAEREQENFKAPFYPIQYLGDFLLEVSKINIRHFKTFVFVKYQQNEMKSFLCQSQKKIGSRLPLGYQSLQMLSSQTPYVK